MFSALLLSAVISSACALLLKTVIRFSAACAATVPVMASGRQWHRRRYDAADHPARLGFLLRRRGAA
jgi:hypothetical protein